MASSSSTSSPLIDRKMHLKNALINTEIHNSYLYQLLSSDSKNSPLRFAEKPELTFECSPEFKENLSNLFNYAQKGYPILDGYWVLLLKKQISFEIDIGWIKTKEDGQERIKELYQAFVTLFQKQSREVPEIREGRNLPTEFKRIVAKSIPGALYLNTQLEKCCDDPQFRIILVEFKADNVGANLSRVIALFKSLIEKQERFTPAEALTYKNLMTFFTYLNAALDILTNYKPQSLNEKIKLGLMIVAINNVCINVMIKNNCENHDLELFLGYLRGIKNMGIKDASSLTRVVNKFSTFFSSDTKPPEARIIKEMIKNNILELHPNYKKDIKEITFDKAAVDSIASRLRNPNTTANIPRMS